MAVETNHPDFPAPPSETVIWRYSSLSKLLSLLATQSLYLSNINSLRHEDPFEGSATLANRRLADQLRHDKELYQNHYGQADSFLRQIIAQQIGDPARHIQGTLFVNCWHSNQHESMALWQIYAGRHEGVAIKSNIQKLSRATDSNFSLILGSVVYADYENTYILPGNAYTPVFTKRICFEHEREIRLLYAAYGEYFKPKEERAAWARDAELKQTDEGMFVPVKVPPGIIVACNAAELIDEIVVSPFAEPWVVDSIASAVSALGCKAPVRRSNLLDTLV